MGNKMQSLSLPGYLLASPGGLQQRLAILPQHSSLHPGYSPSVTMEAVVACPIIIEHPANIFIQLRSINLDVHLK